MLMSRIKDPLYTDQLARLNRVTNAMSQHLTTLNSYVTGFTDLDSQQQALLTAIKEQKTTLDDDSRARLTGAIPFITEQNKVMESVETRVNKARAKLSEQTDMVLPPHSKVAFMLTVSLKLGDINDRISENRRMMSFPPPSSRTITSAPPLPSRSRQSSVDVPIRRESTFSDDEEPSGWKCVIA
jgi:hypothetical protein